jgi:hypothetical protein
MNQPLFEERPIAVIWDFDKTLIPDSMQRPIFRRFDVDEKKFWDEADGLPQFYEKQGVDLVSGDTLYLNHILSYVRAGRFEGLNNVLLHQLGAELEFYPGLPGFFATARAMVADEPYPDLRITVEHYIVSTGLRQMILGSKIAPYVDGVWGCEFVEQMAPPGYLEPSSKTENSEAATESEIQEIAYTIDNTTKTRAVFEISKGVNKEPKRINVNSAIPYEDRRVPFENMIYIADGPSDVPVFSIVRRFGGKTYAVYNPDSQDEFDQVHVLLEQDRVDAVGEANYEPEKQASRWILRAIKNTATRMLETRKAQREAHLASRVGVPPKHLGNPSRPDGEGDGDAI